MAEVRKAIVIGAGPAGIAAAIYLKRAGLEPLVIERGDVGGLLSSANFVENYPGFPEGMTGLGLVSRLDDHLQALGIHLLHASVKEAHLARRSFKINTDAGSFSSKTLLVGTGTKPKKIELAGDPAAKRRIGYDITALAADGAGGRVLIIGGGDAAFDYALNLDSRGYDVTIVSRSAPQCLALLGERVERRGIAVATGCEPVKASMRRGGLELECRKGSGKKEFEADRILVAIGREPNIDVLCPAIARRLLVIGRGPETNIPGLFLIGDVVGGEYRQTGIAVGSGIMAAMMAERMVKGKEGAE